MKKSLFAFIFLLTALAGFGQRKKIQDLTGKWEIAGEQQAGGALEVIDSSTIYLTYMGEKKKILDYQVDFSKTPYWFDFTIQDTAGIVKVKSLLEVMNDSVIKWQLFIGEERANYFTSSKGELYYLKRAKKEAAVLSSNND